MDLARIWCGQPLDAFEDESDSAAEEGDERLDDRFQALLTTPVTPGRFRIVLVPDWSVHLYFADVTPQCDVTYTPVAAQQKWSLN